MTTGVKDYGNDPGASACKVYGYLGLAAAVITQACADLKSPDPLIVIDALAWLVSDDPPIWLEATTGIELEPERLFILALGGPANGHNPKFRFGGRTTKASPEHDRP